MTEEKLNEGKRLMYKLESLKTEKETWKRVTMITSMELNIGCGNSTVNLRVNPNLIGFKELRLLMIAKLDKKITEVQTKFNEL